METMILNTLFLPNIEQLGSQWYFWVILAGIIGFIIYYGWNRSKKEKTQRKQREKEVKQAIKNHLANNSRFKNITIAYEDVVARTGKKYNYRDVFDVFIKIVNVKKKNWKPIYKCYEIEGFAKYLDPKDKKSDVMVDWQINNEFEFTKHKKFLKEKPPSKISIYFKSIFKGKKRQEFMESELKRIAEIKSHRQNIDKNSSQKTKTEPKEVFNPPLPARDDKDL